MLRRIFIHMIFVAFVLRAFISCLKAINHAESDISRKPYQCRIQWVCFKVLTLNFCYYKYCNEIKLSTLLCTKKSAPDFRPEGGLHINRRIREQNSFLILNKKQARNHKYLITQLLHFCKF